MKLKQIGNCIDDLLSSLDLFGQPITLLYKQREQFSSRVGQFVTIILILITMHAFGSLSLDMFTQSYPNVAFRLEPKQDPDNQLFYLNMDNFQIVVSLEDYDRNPIQNKVGEWIYHLEFHFCSLERKKIDDKYRLNKSCLTIPSVPCNSSNAAIGSLKISDYMKEHGHCVNQTYWNMHLQETYLFGQLSGQTYSSLEIALKPCANGTQEICAQADQINKSLSEGRFEMIFLDHTVNQEYPGNPYKKTPKNIHSRYSDKSCSEITIQMRHSFFQSQKNFFYYFPSNEFYHEIVFVDTVQSVSSKRNEIVKVDFSLEPTEEHYFRYYSTFFDILGNVGGIQSFLLFTLGLIIRPLTKMQGTIELVNSIYEFQYGSKDEAQKLRQKSKRSSDPAPKMLKEPNRGLTIQAVEMLTVSCCGQKKNLVTKSLEKIGQQIDISNMLNKLLEIDKLKRLLLTESQLLMFSYIPRPVISNHYYKQGTIQTELQCIDQDVEEDFLESLVQAYTILLKGKGLDQKLVGMLDAKTKVFLNQMLRDTKQIEKEILIHDFQNADNQIIDRRERSIELDNSRVEMIIPFN